MSLAKLRQLLKENKELIIGENTVIKNIKLGKVKLVFLANNCKVDIKEDLQYYAKQSNFELIELDINAKELGSICKKQFPISVLAY